MPANNFTAKADTTQPYRVDSRATVNQPLKPVSVDMDGGPHLTPTSGVRVNYPSGTDN